MSPPSDTSSSPSAHSVLSHSANTLPFPLPLLRRLRRVTLTGQGGGDRGSADREPGLDRPKLQRPDGPPAFLPLSLPLGPPQSISARRGAQVNCTYYPEEKFAKNELVDPVKIGMIDAAKQQQVWSDLEKQYDMGLVTNQSRSGLGSWQYRR